MCKVLTQDKSRLIDVSNTDIFIEKKDKNIFNISIYRFNRSVVLGTFKTECIAKRVLASMAVSLGNAGYYKVPEYDDFEVFDLVHSVNLFRYRV